MLPYGTLRRFYRPFKRYLRSSISTDNRNISLRQRRVYIYTVEPISRLLHTTTPIYTYIQTRCSRRSVLQTRYRIIHMYIWIYFSFFNSIVSEKIQTRLSLFIYFSSQWRKSREKLAVERILYSNAQSPPDTVRISSYIYIFFFFFSLFFTTIKYSSTRRRHTCAISKRRRRTITDKKEKKTCQESSARFAATRFPH